MKIALVEDTAALRDTFADVLSAVHGHELVCAYPTAEEARRDLHPGKVDLFVVDLDLPGETGVEFIRWLHGSGHGIPSVVWTIHEGRDVVYAALKAGAVGYLIKSIQPVEMQVALDEIQAGGAPMSPRIARRLLNDLMDTTTPVPPIESLTTRERSILRAVARGESYKQISAAFGISPNTVHTHLNNIYRKLHVIGRAEALARAQAMGLIVRA